MSSLGITMEDQTNFRLLSLLLWQSVTDTEWAEKLKRGTKMSLLCIRKWNFANGEGRGWIMCVSVSGKEPDAHSVTEYGP